MRRMFYTKWDADKFVAWSQPKKLGLMQFLYTAAVGAMVGSIVAVALHSPH